MAGSGETCRGLVLRSTDISDNDKLLTVLSAEYGKISICAKGARSLKSKYMAVSQQFAYADFTYTERGGYRWLKDASLVESFFSVRRDISRLALACYIASVGEQLALEHTEDIPLLRLLLNTLYLLCEDKYEIPHIKAVFELFATSNAGFQPEIECCGSCGSVSDISHFDIIGGVCLCSACAKALYTSEGVDTTFLYPITPGIIDAVKYVLSPSTKNVFSFKLPEDEMKSFRIFCEKYLLSQLDCGFKTLSFYHEVTD